MTEIFSYLLPRQDEIDFYQGEKEGRETPRGERLFTCCKPSHFVSWLVRRGLSPICSGTSLMNVQAKPNRDLLDPNFESYKLSLRRTAVLSASEPNGIDLKTLGQDTFSKLEIRLYFLHNALIQDRFSPDTFYYFSADGQIKGVAVRPRKELFCSGSTVWKVPSWTETLNRGSKCNASMKLLSDYAIVCDGARNLYILDTPNRISKSFSAWKVVLEFELPTVAPSTYLVDAIQSPSSAEIHCLLVSVVAAVGSSKSKVHLDWLTFGNAERKIYFRSILQLQALVERLPRRDLLIVAGDWNGRTGPGDPTTSHLLGRFGLGSRCENGERLLNFADRNRLLVTNTCFQHRKKHLLTWYSNDGCTASQIDYILVSSRFRSWVHDSRSMRGAETGNAYGSDHVLVRTRLKVHLSSAPKMPRPRRLDVAKIRQASTAEALSREIRTCFTTRADGEVSNQWSSLKTSVYGAAEKILGYTQRRRSDWISGRTLQLSAQTARARSRNDDYFRQLRKMTAKSARDDRKQYWAEIATSMEQASNVGDTRKLYQLIRQVSGKPSTLNDSVRDVNGGFIADNSAKVERWREHFEHHLNYDTQLISPLLSSSAEFPPSPTYAVPCDPPSEEEIVDAIRKLRNNKAPGEDGIPAEIFKSCVDTLAPWLHEVIERAWRDEVVPDDWGLGILVPILKKGDKTRCENYRGISLIDVTAKIFAIVLLRRFQAVRDSRTRPNQAGFRAGRGCADQIFTLRRILEFRHSYQQPTAVCFVDFAAAFDSVHRESLWRIMALDGVPAKIIAMIKAYYRSTTARVLVRNNLSQPFGIRSGVRQGCILSPILFNYAIDWILGRALRGSDGVEFAPGHRLTDLDYADDIALLASSFGDLQSMVSRVNEVAKSVGLSINAGKTKVFSSCIPVQEKAPLGIDGCQLEEVDSFKYLGARLLPNGQSKDGIVSRINAARSVFSSLRKCLWNRRDLSIATKIRVYRASVRSVLLYGCECWALRVEDERKLEVFDHHCLRIILRVKFTDFVSNEAVRARCDKIARITQAIQEGRLRWFGHVLRRPPQELSVTALDPAPLPHWRSRRGGQFKTWLDTVRQDMEVVLGPSVFGLRRWRREWVELSRSAAADRHAWRVSSETWSLVRHRSFSSLSFPDYAVFEQTSSSLTICTSDPFSAVLDSANPEIKPAEPSNPSPQPPPEDGCVTSPLRFTWSQCQPDASEDDSRLVNILIHLGSQKPTVVSKEAFRISCVSSAPADHGGFSIPRIIIQMLTEDPEKPPVTLCDTHLFAPVNCGETMWTYDKETNCLDVTLIKISPTPWLRLFADATEEERLNVQYDETTTDGSRLGQADTDAGQMQGNFNVEQLEDVDMAAAGDDVDLLLQRIDGETLKTTMKVELLGNQWLYNAPLKANAPASHLLCVRHDVDGLLWCPAPQWPQHVATLQAFGYVLASKRSHRFVASPPAHITGTNVAHLPFVAVADLARHIYVYWQPPARRDASEMDAEGDDDATSALLPGPGEGNTELRRRRVGGGDSESRVVHVAWQQVVSLPDAEEIIGFAALASPLPACVVATKQRLYLTSLVEEN
ncbi:hypothetical protein SprV_0401588200 [Sparganum proliferum]